MPVAGGLITAPVVPTYNRKPVLRRAKPDRRLDQKNINQKRLPSVKSILLVQEEKKMAHLSH